MVKEAWTETVTEDVYDQWECCNVCGADCTADPSGHMKQHALAGEGGGRHTEYYKTVTRTVEHPAEYGTRYVVDTPAWTETVSDGFFCIGCGVLWSSIFVTLMANKIGGLQFGIYRNCQISSRVFHTAVAALPLTKANRSDFE